MPHTQSEPFAYGRQPAKTTTLSKIRGPSGQNLTLPTEAIPL
jgi:hypothetical protein